MHAHVSPEVRKKIKEIEIHTRRLLRGSMVGDSRSAVKGTGFEFDQIREYYIGDDIRFIDWNASARNNTMLVKQYIEERSRVIFLVVDVSASTFLGSGATSKHDSMAQIASILALVSESGKDRVGLILFSDEIELYLPPAQGRYHITAIMEALFTYKPRSKKTNIAVALKKLAALKRRDAVAFLITDAIDDSLDSRYLALVARMYDLVMIRCLDECERKLPAVGFLPVQDGETGELLMLDTRYANKQLHGYLERRLFDQNTLMKKKGVEVLDMVERESFFGELIRFFRRRMRY